MHTIALIEREDRLHIYHNSDWSGDVFVDFIERRGSGLYVGGGEELLTEERLVRWTVPGYALLRGQLTPAQIEQTDSGRPVPAQIIARVVALAVRRSIVDEIVNHAGGLY